MTDDSNVVPIDNARKNGKTWRITAVRYKQGQVLVQDSEGKQEVVNAFVLNIQWLDREPSRLITNNGDKGHKDINIPIPIGITKEQLYAILMGIPEQLDAHLDGVVNPEDGGAA